MLQRLATAAPSEKCAKFDVLLMGENGKTIESQINEIVEDVKKELYSNKDKILKEMKKKNHIY